MEDRDLAGKEDMEEREGEEGSSYFSLRRDKRINQKKDGGPEGKEEKK